MRIHLTKTRTIDFSLTLVLFGIIYLLFNIEDLGASAQTGNGGADRSIAHIALLGITVFLLLDFVFCRKKNRSDSLMNSLVMLLFWTAIVNIVSGVSTWTLLVQENMSLLWILSYLFFGNIRCRYNNDKPIKSFAMIFFVFFVGATVYYFFDMYIRLNRFPVLNVIYCAIALLPWILVNSNGNGKHELLLFTVIIVATLFSMKRGAIIAIVLMIITYYFTQAILKNSFSLFCKIIFITILLISSFLYADILSGGFLSERFSREEMATGSGRFEQYMTVLWVLKESDWFHLFFGNGSQKSIELLGTGVHNEWLSFLFCYGIVGVFLYATMFFGFFKQSAKIRKTDAKLSAPCYMMIVFFFVLSMVSTGYGGYVGLLLFGFWGFINAESKKIRCKTGE